MSPLITVVFLLLLLLSQIRGGSSDDDFFELCPESRCSTRGDAPTIRFPFRLNTQPAFCGLEGFVLSCSNNTTLFHFPSSGNFQVREISYLNAVISINLHNSDCPMRSFLSLNTSGTPFGDQSGSWGSLSLDFTVVNCTGRIEWGGSEGIVRPVDCMSHENNLVYLSNGYASMNKLPSQCRTFRAGRISGPRYVKLDQIIERLFERQEIFLSWSQSDGCFACENSGNFCGFNTTSNATICSTPRPIRSHSALILATTIGGTAFLGLALLALYRIRRSDGEKETQLKIERFLANYRTLNPTRYSYSDLKKMTGNFRHKIGQGGFGSVYRGKLPNGVPAAVKMIVQNSKGNGKEFINEVATIGRIHHFNVVRLLGFCSEGTRRALVYEFMPNESLEKFIFSSKEARTRNRPFGWEKLQQIAVGIARGIEYLHQGCDQRILHFDIKPHNILLDHNFQPKISDFGLAKLCSKEQSIVSMTDARGTAGYIAPELFSRNFGAVSHKSDVYSFGMLLLEIVGCRRNIDPTVENASQIYFPEWIYNRMVQGEEMGLEIEVDGDDDEIARKLAIVALWCIQWNPTDRPSMTMVVQMLEGHSHGLEIPPKPFVSSSDIEIIAT